MASVRSLSFLKMFRRKKHRYHPISDFSDSQTLPLLQNHCHNQLVETESEHDVQAFWEKVSVLEREIGALKSNIFTIKTKLQTQAKEGNNQQQAITCLVQSFDRLKNNVDGIILDSKETSRQGGAIIKLEEDSNNLEKKVAELETRVNETTSSIIDMMAVVSELKDNYSSHPQEAVGEVPESILVSEIDLLAICFLVLVFIVTFVIGKNL